MVRNSILAKFDWYGRNYYRRRTLIREISKSLKVIVERTRGVRFVRIKYDYYDKFQYNPPNYPTNQYHKIHFETYFHLLLEFLQKNQLNKFQQAPQLQSHSHHQYNNKHN